VDDHQSTYLTKLGKKEKKKKKRLFFCFNFVRVSGLVMIIHKKELAKFGYNKSERKIQFFLATYYPLASCWNLWSIYMAISSLLSSKYWRLWPIFFPKRKKPL
jgi:hypothetical protein